MKHLLIVTLTLLVFFSGCSKNPVTGESEFTLITEKHEIEIGESSYYNMRQMEGGDYLTVDDIQEYVSNVGQKIALNSDRPDLPYEFSVINNDTPNAWALPGGKISINRGLILELENESELAAVLAHEIVHSAARHTAQRMERQIFMQTGILGLGMATQDNNYGAILTKSALLGSQLISFKYSRKAELEADKYGIKYMAHSGYDPEAAVTLQKKFLALSDSNEPSWTKGLLATHPPSQERIDENIKTAAQYNIGGFLGYERYQEKISALRKQEECYPKISEGYKSLHDKNYPESIKLGQEASKIAPKETYSYMLQGESYYLMEEYEKALKKLDQAIKYNSEMFYSHLLRGRTYIKLGNNDKAIEDLEKSIRLLPTHLAYLSLGKAEFYNGDIEQAKDHLSIAADSRDDGDNIALMAKMWLQRINITDTPENYIQFKYKSGLNNELILIYYNNSLLNIDSMTVDLHLDEKKIKTLYIDEKIKTNKVLEIKTGIKLSYNKEQIIKVDIFDIKPENPQ